ncbi:MAG: VOC family protein [Acidimicrobiales bacterium]
MGRLLPRHRGARGGTGNRNRQDLRPGGPPRIWFQVVPETKSIKNRLHLDIDAGGGRAVPIDTRRQRVDAEASRLAGLGAAIAGVLYQEGLDHYGVAMTDPEGNEFDIA